MWAMAFSTVLHGISHLWASPQKPASCWLPRILGESIRQHNGSPQTELDPSIYSGSQWISAKWRTFIVGDPFCWTSKNDESSFFFICRKLVWLFLTGGGTYSVTGGFGVVLSLIDHSTFSGSDNLQFNDGSIVPHTLPRIIFVWLFMYSTIGCAGN